MHYLASSAAKPLTHKSFELSFSGLREDCLSKDSVLALPLGF